MAKIDVGSEPPAARVRNDIRLGAAFHCSISRHYALTFACAGNDF
jgi:hypothetical protein